MNLQRLIVVSCVVALLPACAVEVDDSASVPPSEPLGSEREAADAAMLDTAVATAVNVKVRGKTQRWVFVCDAFGKLQMNTSPATDPYLPAVWTGWKHIDSGCVGAPSAIADPNGSAADSAVSLFVTWNDGHLWRYVWEASTHNPYWQNVSAAVGWSSVAPVPPVAVYGNRALAEVSVATRNHLYQVHTIDFYDGSWHARLVQDNHANVIVTPYRLGAPADAQNERGGFSYLTGRKSQTVGWVTRRPYGQRSRFVSTAPFPDFRTTGAPVVVDAGPDAIGVVALYQDGASLAHTTYPSGSLTQYFNCPFGGPPTFPLKSSSWGFDGYSGFVRNDAGQLVRYAAGTLLPAGTYIMGATLPEPGVRFIESAMSQGGFSREVYYAGLGGELAFYSDYRDVEQYLGIKVAF